MALVKYGAGIVQMAGSIGGTTFARNNGGNYARARTTPINPNTALQVAVRASLAFLTTRWSQTLTAAQRTAWNLYAASVIMQNRLDQSINLSGFNHYIRSNSILKVQGITLIDDGPTLFEIPEADPTFAAVGSEAGGTISVVFDDTAAWANEDEAYLFVFQGRPQNAQRNGFGGPWRFMNKIEGDGTTAPTSPVVMPVSFAIAEGQRQWVYGRIARADGRLSARFRADAFTSS